MFTVGSLCSGIGGLELGLEWCGMRTVWQAETDPYASAVLARHWPGVPNLGDIRAVDWATVPRVDLICAGYPCQPFSFAGNRGGTDDPRHLWPAVADSVRVLRPRIVLLENVPGHLSLGFGDVLGDLAELGYDAVWTRLSARDVGAPHLRQRIFIVAYPDRDGERFARRTESDVRAKRSTLKASRRDHARGFREDVPDSHRDEHESGPSAHERETVADVLPDSPRPRRQRIGTDRETDRRSRLVRRGVSDSHRAARPAVGTSQRGDRPRASGLAAQPGGRGGRPGRDTGAWWAIEPDVGRVAYGVPSRVDRLRCLGNAVVPQVSFWIGQWIIREWSVTPPSTAPVWAPDTWTQLSLWDEDVS